MTTASSRPQRKGRSSLTSRWTGGPLQATVFMEPVVLAQGPQLLEPVLGLQLVVEL